jgi:DNA (cytosine-5)-methyltransferase 1
MKILNLYAGIGGNRKLWTNVDVTAVEFNEEIASIYRDHFPNDTVIVGDANEYLRKHYKEFDFIWSSPPCQSHSKVRMMASKGGSYDAIFPDMKLWQEIIFLQHFFKGTYVVENVQPYYEPLVKPSVKLDRHLIWSNCDIPYKKIDDGLTHNERGSSKKGFFDLSKYRIKHRKDQIIRNCVNPELGNYVLKCVLSKEIIK